MDEEKIEYTGPVPDHVRTHMERANAIIDKGGEVYWKWTCAGCGSRQTFENANSLHITGICEECSHVTIIFTAAADVGFDALLIVKGEK